MNVKWDGKTLTFCARIDEHVEYGDALALKGPVDADFGEVDEINSSGIRRLLIWVQSRGKEPTRYLNCPRMLVDYFNTIPHLLGTPPVARRVHSLRVPFLCPACENPEDFLIETSELDLEADPIQLPKRLCSHCGKATKLDTEPEEYFSFLLTY